jgi:hypothetical protein
VPKNAQSVWGRDGYCLDRIAIQNNVREISEFTRYAHCNDTLVSKQFEACSTQLFLLFDAIYNDGYLLFQGNLPI